MNKLIVNLLAKEDITVQVGNYKTAFFVPKTRTLGLPLWTSESKHLNDLMIGHEVGHALYTPTQGWHDAKEEVPGIPRSFINIIEDIRIEKLVIRTYPGLVLCFKRGYMDLLNRNFFGIDDKDVNSLHFIDRLNIKAKVRNLLDINFTDEEQPLLKAAMAVETWEDTLRVCRMLGGYADELKERQKEKEKEMQDLIDNLEDEEPSDEVAEDSASDEVAEDSVSDEPSDQAEEAEEDSGGDEPSDQADEDSAGSMGKKGSHDVDMSKKDDFETPPEPFTDSAFREHEKNGDLTQNGGEFIHYIKAVSKKTTKTCVVGYKEVLDNRKNYQETALIEKKITFKEMSTHNKKKYDDFMETSKSSVSLMIKEFDLKKHAFQYQRATTSSKGVLDVNRMFSYKYDDDVFKSVTNLADAKSHGMVMFIDASGSMNGDLGDVIKQSLILAAFCKRAYIPFDIYTFTCSSSNESKHREKVIGITHTLQDQDIDVSDSIIRHILSSRMNKDEYTSSYHFLLELAIEGPYGDLIRRNYPIQDYRLGGTPLVETIMMARHIIRDFKRLNNVQKVTAIFLTDGDGGDVNHHLDPSMNAHRVDPAYFNRQFGRLPQHYKVEIDGKIYTYNTREDRYKNLQKDMFEYLQTEFNVIGYFVATNKRQMEKKMNYAAFCGYKKPFDIYSMNKEFRKNHFVPVDNVLGYNRLFFMNTKDLNAEKKEFEVQENATATQIRSAFKKHSVGKKSTRLFATKFIEMIA